MENNISLEEKYYDKDLEKGVENLDFGGSQKQGPKGPLFAGFRELWSGTSIEEMVWDRSEDNRQESAVLRSGL